MNNKSNNRKCQIHTDPPLLISHEDASAIVNDPLEVQKEKRNRTKRPRKKSGFQFIIFFAEMYESKEWRELSPAEKIFYKHLKGRYTSKNNGDIVFPYSAMKGVKGCSTPNTAAKAAEGLIKKGWIKRKQSGGEYRVIYFYELTFNYDLFDGKYIDGKKKTKKPYVVYERQLCHHNQWKRLSAPAKIFYECLKGRYLAYNNGRLKLSYGDMKGVKGCSSIRAVSKAIKELKDKGWGDRTKTGGLYRHNNLYGLTFKVDKFDGGNISKSKYDKKKRKY